MPTGSKGTRYSALPEEEKERQRKKALDYYRANREKIRERRKLNKFNPEFQRKRKIREERYKPSWRRYHLKKNYGITPDEWNDMLIQQDGRCAICSRDFSEINKKHIHVDHNHMTGAIRQMLCHKCNQGIGSFNEDVSLLRAAVQYIQRWSLV